MKLAYVAGPYRDVRGAFYIGENINRARELAAQLWRMGAAVICPHANTAFFDGIATDDTFLQGDLEMLKRCDFLVTLPRWTLSAGAREEVEFANRHNIPIFHWAEEITTGNIREYLEEHNAILENGGGNEV